MPSVDMLACLHNSLHTSVQLIPNAEYWVINQVRNTPCISAASLDHRTACVYTNTHCVCVCHDPRTRYNIKVKTLYILFTRDTEGLKNQAKLFVSFRITPRYSVSLRGHSNLFSLLLPVSQDFAAFVERHKCTVLPWLFILSFESILSITRPLVITVAQHYDCTEQLILTSATRVFSRF